MKIIRAGYCHPSECGKARKSVKNGRKRQKKELAFVSDMLYNVFINFVIKCTI